MPRLGRIATFCLLVVSCCAAAPLATLPITEQSLAQLRQQHPLASAEVNDPVYKRTMNYQGIWLRDILKGLSAAGHRESDIYVRFRCKDGYLPGMPLVRAKGAQGLIALRDTKAPPGADWQPLPGNTAATPGPAYLVWVSPPGDPEEYPWPYQIVAIELVPSSDGLAALAGESTKVGRELFITHCIKCHAINGIGGTFGPELNSPCSVTEYWNPHTLRRFIADASSVRAGTKMPSFQSLPEQDVHLIVAYLLSMSRHKKPGAKCP